ncbi:protein Wnt-4a-like protein [Willisornis vidua]|uniref:Protein Wnt n=1 Tax=Willisornis vidua TaxID=1566151 RepID=A0ABQ9D1X3_9PASS|nr:protein Wnt-4a-like protein [Willisornis vidua]
MDRMEMVCVYTVLIPMQYVAAVIWLYWAKQTSLHMSLRDPRGCDGLAGLIEEQGRISQQQVEAMDEGLQVFDKVAIQGTQESDFTHAISAAGIAFAVTRACRHRELEKCGFVHKIQGVSLEGFQWSGCSDNLPYGIVFSQAFVDNPERSCSVFSS